MTLVFPLARGFCLLAGLLFALRLAGLALGIFCGHVVYLAWFDMMEERDKRAKLTFAIGSVRTARAGTTASDAPSAF